MVRLKSKVIFGAYFDKKPWAIDGEKSKICSALKFWAEHTELAESSWQFLQLKIKDMADYNNVRNHFIPQVMIVLEYMQKEDLRNYLLLKRPQ